MIHVFRHAHAGRRADWDGDDVDRPLSARGRAEAEAIAGRLAPLGVRRILTSPYLRCVQSVEPLAGAVGVPVEVERALAEEAPGHLVDALLAGVGPGAVLCSHGDVISGLLGRLAAGGTDLDAGLVWEKGSVWHLEPGASGRVASGAYDPPPVIA
ncbi:MAG: histidine phosphatase family protein [Actinobacteria bacterium]|nr:histidine phosphatase family protein [Actinomycetota bacterium]